MLHTTYNMAGWAYNLHAIPYDGVVTAGEMAERQRSGSQMTLRARLAALMTNRPRSTAR